MFQSLVAKLRPVANDRSRSAGSRMTSLPMPMPAISGPAQRVGAVAAHDVQRVDAVAERLGHLAMLGVAHGAVQVHRVERRLLPMNAYAGHDHPRDPEEQDLGRGDEHVGRVERLAGRRDCSSGQPSVESGQSQDENQVSSTSSSWRTAPPQRRAARDGSSRLHDRIGAARVAVPHRNAMPPPELPRDVPVANALQPVHVHRFPPLGQDADRAVAHRLQRRLGERLHAHEPLVRQARLHHRVAAVAVTHRVLVCARPSPARPIACEHAARCARAPRSDRGRAAPRARAPPRRSLRRTRPLGVDDDRHRRGRAACRPRSRSASCAGVIFTAPVPNSGSVYSSAITGMSHVGDRQPHHRFPRGRGSARRPGSRRRATSPSIVSGRVVATVMHARRIVGQRIAHVVQLARGVVELRLLVARAR